MKILVLSDSHSALRYMRQCIDAVKPDAVIHLGDLVGDGETMQEEYPALRFYQVAGNCDRYRVAPDFPEILVEKLGGAKIYMTHGHLQGVKLYLDKLILDGQRCGADVILYGHTHEPDCAVKQAVDEGIISAERYNSYLGMLEEDKKFR